MTSLLLFYSCICAAVDAYEGSIKVTGGNFSTYTPELADEKSPQYKEMANKIISTVRNGCEHFIKDIRGCDEGARISVFNCQLKFQPLISQLSVNFADIRSELFVKKCVISQLTVNILMNSQLSFE